jgi:phosphatidylserine/phosphatidylglycerophosphate/cardiolipin synthase-like enzyme
MSALLSLSTGDVVALKDALRSGRLAPPYLPALVERIVPAAVAVAVSRELREMVASGATGQGLVVALELLARARAEQLAIDEVVEVVTTGPDAGRGSRDTQVVVQDLFRNAERSVLVAGYELYQAAPLFRGLADRMAAAPELRVRMFLNIKRPVSDTTAERELISGFGHRFRTKHWPVGRPLPEVYFDPRSLSTDLCRKAVLHAKCIVVDERIAFVSSANFTEAAQERNIEVGILVRDEAIARKVAGFFDDLRAHGHVARAM